jgi:hypothetical protein
MDRLGQARTGEAGIGVAVEARRGKVAQGMERKGGRGRDRRGTDRRRAAGTGLVWHGKVRQGEAGPG